MICGFHDGMEGGRGVVNGGCGDDGGIGGGRFWLGVGYRDVIVEKVMGEGVVVGVPRYVEG